MKTPPYYMTTSEVADYLRMNERTIYGLAARNEIPCSKATGKLLFPKVLIDRWVETHIDYANPLIAAPPPLICGSSDPLLEWALRESGSDLTNQVEGSSVGMERLCAGAATAAGVHFGYEDKNEDSGNLAAIRNAPLPDGVLVHFAWREQGLVLPAGETKIRSLRDIADGKMRFIQRQDGSGTQILFDRLMAEAGLSSGSVNILPNRALTQTDVALAILDGTADCGMAVNSVAQRFKLTFVPLHRERFDLACRRRELLEPPMQKLFAFTRTEAFRAHAQQLGGYDVEKCGEILFNR
jgi:putative molybdopterin biosynthesis protein